jgi:hypothetical protein
VSALENTRVNEAQATPSTVLEDAIAAAIVTAVAPLRAQIAELTQALAQGLYRVSSGYRPHGAILNPPQKNMMATPKVMA